MNRKHEILNSACLFFVYISLSKCCGFDYRASSVAMEVLKSGRPKGKQSNKRGRTMAWFFLIDNSPLISYS
jgi:hypothetical protein